MNKNKMIELIKDALEILTIPQYTTLTVNTVIQQLNLSTGKITTIDDLERKDEVIVRSILEELMRNVRITMETRQKVLSNGTPLGF